jgi:peptidoglycan/xylan/chitin deacetylase (PgdA/CDA1 family)
VDTNENTNTSTTEPELTTVPEGVCTEPIAKYGDNKVAVLTFEMSAANDNAKQLLAQLKKNKTPASFFATGTFAEKYPDFLKSIVTDGYSVYNRGYDSTNLTSLTAETIPIQLTKAAVAIEAATGLSPTPYLRPAFSDTNEVVVKAATEAGYCIILGTIDATDWQDGVTAEAAVDRVMAKLQPGMIIQLHAGYDITAATVAGLEAEMKAKGYSLVTLPTLLNS